jgi:uncharacterized protein YjbJ (UPF0337 family)
MSLVIQELRGEKQLLEGKVKEVEGKVKEGVVSEKERER